MDWMNALNNVVQRYTGSERGAAAAPEDPHRDFDEVVRAAPPEVVAGGISQMFRSDQTPSFPEMIGNLFRHSDGTQRAGVLNHLLGSISPGALSSLPGLGALTGPMGQSISPQKANQVTPEQAQEIAAHVEQQDPSIVDKVSSFYSRHPQLMQAVGGMALTVALQHMMRRR